MLMNELEAYVEQSEHHALHNEWLDILDETDSALSSLQCKFADGGGQQWWLAAQVHRNALVNLANQSFLEGRENHIFFVANADRACVVWSMDNVARSVASNLLPLRSSPLQGPQHRRSRPLQKYRISRTVAADALVVYEGGGKALQRSQVVGFHASSEVSKYVLDELRKQALVAGDVTVPTIQDAQSAINEALGDLFHSMAMSLRRIGSDAQFALSSGGRLAVDVAKAILARVPVDFYSNALFANTLYEEIWRTVIGGTLRGRGWEIVRTPTGELSLSTHALPNDASMKPRPPIERAKFRRFGS